MSKSNNMTKDEEFVFNLLSGVGFQVTKLPESDKKSVQTPDFLAVLEDVSYIVELKSKSANRDKKTNRERTLTSGEVHGEIEPLVRMNPCSRIIESAKSQLKASSDDSAFHIAWFMAVDYNSSSTMHQFKAALYGSMTLVDFSTGTHGVCYYFENSDFYRFRDNLDGAIVSSQEELILCINTLSPRYSEFRQSPICRVLESGLCDPEELAQQGVAYIVDGDMNRGNKEEVLAYLQNKHQQPMLTDMGMIHMAASVLVKQ